MTLRTSAVAVCCCKEFAQLVQKPRVLDRDHRLLGKGGQQIDLLFGEGLNARPANHDDAEDHTLPEHRHRHDRAMHLFFSAVFLGPPVLGVREDVGDVHDASLQNGSSRSRRSVLVDRIPLHHLDKVRRMAEAGCNAIKLSVLPVDEALVRAAETDGILYQRLQHYLQVEGRPADDLEHVCRGGLLLQRLAQLVEQARVLNRDDGLLRKILQQRYLCVRERTDLLTIDSDSTN